MADEAKDRDRVKKFLMLATSLNEHEAARARENAERLMLRHGWTPADFEDDVVEVADDRRDDLRRRLAAAVAVSRRCRLFWNDNGQLAFRGKSAPAVEARRVYQQLVVVVTSSCEIGPTDPGRVVWRLCFWTGFVDAVVERLADAEARAWIPPDASGKADPPPAERSVESELDAATMDFASFFHPVHRETGVRMLRADAYARGRHCGESVHIEERSRVSSKRGLGDGR